MNKKNGNRILIAGVIISILSILEHGGAELLAPVYVLFIFLPYMILAISGRSSKGNGITAFFIGSIIVCLFSLIEIIPLTFSGEVFDILRMIFSYQSSLSSKLMVSI